MSGSLHLTDANNRHFLCEVCLRLISTACSGFLPSPEACKLSVFASELPTGLNTEVLLSGDADLRSTRCIVRIITTGPPFAFIYTVSLSRARTKRGNAKHPFLRLKYGMQPSMKRLQKTKYFIITCKSLAKTLFQPTAFYVIEHGKDTEMVLGNLFHIWKSVSSFYCFLFGEF